MPQPNQIKILYLGMNVWKPVPHCKIHCGIFLYDRPILLYGEIEKTFLQIRIREPEKDVSRFHCVKNSHPSLIEINKFTRLVFGFTQSPFILEGTLKSTLNITLTNTQALLKLFRRACISDDIVSRSNTMEEVEVIKQKSVELFPKGGFNLHMWHSSITLLQSSNTKSQSELTYTKETIKNIADLTKILGVPWDKNRNNLSVVVPEFNEKLITKRNVLSYIASIYQPLCLISASYVIGKVIYRELSDKKLPWDTEILRILKEKLKK